MFIRQIPIESLGNNSYIVGSQEDGVAAVVDPVRDVDIYTGVASELGVKILYALETHIHNDFISGARELAARIGAKVCSGASGGLVYPHVPMKDGDEIDLGRLKIRAIHTPGHTPEHMSYIATDTEGGSSPQVVFTGGALMAGGAARVDLMGDQIAGFLGKWQYRSLHNKLLTLPDDVQVYPTHGGGSFCSAGLPSEGGGETTIGNERRFNPLAQTGSEEEFLEIALSGLGSYPVYYKRMSHINRMGPKLLGGLPMLSSLSPQEVLVYTESKRAIPIDVRHPAGFSEAHIPDSYSIPFGSNFATWVGWVVPWESSLVMVTDDSSVHEEMVRQLIRIGYDQLVGYLDGGIKAWLDKGYPAKSLTRMPLDEFHGIWAKGEVPMLLDVRQHSEWEAFHAKDAINIELGALQEHLEGLPRGLQLATICAAGFRSSTAASILQRAGWEDVINLDGGSDEWREKGYPVEKG